MRYRYLRLALAAALSLVPLAAAVAQPANDNFANLIPLQAAPGQTSISVSGTTVGATREAGETRPVNDCGGIANVWYNTKPVTSGNYTITVDTGNTWDSYLCVFSGSSLADLVVVGGNDDDDTGVLGLGSRAEVALTAGTVYYIMVDGFGSGDEGPFTLTVSGGELLPVELVAFSAAADGRTAHLRWETASETNNAFFAVEHEQQGAWIEMGRVSGHGTTTERHAYAFDVPGLSAGTHTFRLRQTDTDGTVHHSATTTVEVRAPGDLALTPVGSRGVRVESASGATVDVVDVLGRRVRRADASAGTAEVSLSGLPAGAYVVRAASDGTVATARVVVR